jgi:hypothetical protein
MTWQTVLGNWNEQDGRLIQSDTTGITRRALDIGYSNFVARFKFRMTGTAPECNGEVKFILTDAPSEIES